jgi:hypothetical protein
MATTPVNPTRTDTTATAPRDSGPTAEVERLRTLLDKQPSCLMRIGTDGRLLAVNEVALTLLGARTLAEVLDTNFTDRIQGDDAVWADFVRRVSQAGSGSTECEMSDLAGMQRAVMMQGIVLQGHPDGDDSLLVNVRDLTTARRLQASLQEQEDLRRTAQASLDEASASLRDLRSRLEQATAEQERLRAALDGTRAEREQLTAAIDQLKSALDTAIDATVRVQQVTERGGHK